MPELVEDILARVASRLTSMSFFARVLLYTILFTMAVEFVPPILHANICDGLDATGDSCITHRMIHGSDHDPRSRDNSREAQSLRQRER